MWQNQCVSWHGGAEGKVHRTASSKPENAQDRKQIIKSSLQPCSPRSCPSAVRRCVSCAAMESCSGFHQRGLRHFLHFLLLELNQNVLLSPVIPEQGRAQLTPKCLEECLEYGREGGAEHLLLRAHAPCLNFAARMDP